MDYVIIPLLLKDIVEYKFLKWKQEVKPEVKDSGGGDDEDDITFGTEPFFKMLALILSDYKTRNKKSWEDVSNFYKDMKWKPAC